MKSFLFITFLIFSTTSSANVVGVDAQNFNPTTSGLDFVTVHSSKTLAPGILNFGLFLNYAVNTLPIYEPGGATRQQPKDSLTSMDLSMGLGLTNNWDVGISIPQVLSQSVDDSIGAFRGQFENTGINEIRVNSKYRVWDGTSQGFALIGSANFFLIEDYPYTGDSPGPTLNLEMAYDNIINNFTWGANLGYRFRNQGDPILIPTGLPEPFGDQLIASVATSYYFESMDFKLIGEIFGSYPMESQKQSSSRELASAELLVGAKWDFRYDLAAHVGAGTEIFHGTSSPDVRVYAGINWSFGPLFGEEQPPASAFYREEETTEEISNLYYMDNPNVFDKTPIHGDEMFVAKNILFDFNSTKVNHQFEAELAKLANYLMKEPVFQEIVIIGHTDSVGAAAYNKRLSVNRARSISKALAKHLDPIHHRKLKFTGAGESSPIASNSNYQGRALNRRAEFIIKR